MVLVAVLEVLGMPALEPQFVAVCVEGAAEEDEFDAACGVFGEVPNWVAEDPE